jgi:hypothetical protein
MIASDVIALLAAGGHLDVEMYTQHELSDLT